jgi:Mg-chelatase subunit ChlD
MAFEIPLITFVRFPDPDILSVDMDEEQQMQDRLFLFDASRSMNFKLKNQKESKLKLVKDALFSFCSDNWPVSYYDRPIRLGIVAFRLLGVPGESKFEVIVPLYPSPVSLELYRLKDIDAKGGCFLADGLNYALNVLRESERINRRVDLITDADSPQGPDPLPLARMLKDFGIFLNVVEVAENSTMLMQEISSQSNGKYWLVRNLQELLQALL